MKKNLERSKTKEEALNRLAKEMQRTNRLVKKYGKTSPQKQADNQKTDSKS